MFFVNSIAITYSQLSNRGIKFVNCTPAKGTTTQFKYEQHQSVELPSKQSKYLANSRIT